jgi:UPF0042 nucleotide-binding protein
MNTEIVSHLQNVSETQHVSTDGVMLEIKIVSFGYKSGSVPHANMLFDVRFLDNPYWVDDLRPLTGLDKAVQDYVMAQPLAQQFLTGLTSLVMQMLPEMDKREAKTLTIALGCTGGQHRSVSLAEFLAKALKRSLPNHIVKISHRELDGSGPAASNQDP